MEKQKILIVDDSEMNRDLLIDILEDQYDIVETDNGAEAVASAVPLIRQLSSAEFLIRCFYMRGSSGLKKLSQNNSMNRKKIIG